MKLTAKLLKKLIQEELQEKIELGNYKDRTDSLEAAKNELEKLYGIRPESKKDLNMILSKIEQIHSDKLPSESHYDAMGAEYGYQSDYNAAFNKLPGVKAYDLLKKHLSMDEGNYHDMGDKDEMYNALDMPKRLSPKEIYGAFENFVTTNNLDRDDIMGMINMMFDQIRETNTDNTLIESPDLGNINIENVMLVLDALKHLGMIGVASLPIAMKVTQMIDPATKPKDHDPDEDENKRIAKRQQTRRQIRISENATEEKAREIGAMIDQVIDQSGPDFDKRRWLDDWSSGLLKQMANDLGKSIKDFTKEEQSEYYRLRRLASTVVNEKDKILRHNQKQGY